MEKKLFVIIVDDSERDAKLIEREILKEWPESDCVWISTAGELKQALSDKTWNLVISDVRMPELQVSDVINTTLEHDPDLPIIIASGIVSVEDAVDLLKSGAHDFVKKDQLSRLNPAIKRELEDSKNKRLRKEAMELLKTAKLKFEDLYENAPDMYLSIDAKTREVLECNDATARVLGYDKDELIGMDLLQLYDEDYHDKVNKVFTGFLKTGEIHDEDYCVKRKDGSKVFVSLNASAVRDEQGKIVSSRSIWRNITDRKKMEEEIHDSEERLKFLISSSPAVIYTSKVEGDFAATFISDNVRKQLGYDPEDFLNDPDFWLNHIHPDDRPGIIAGLEGVMEKNSHFHEYRFLANDGSYFWMRDELLVVRNPDGSPESFVGCWSDITDRKQAEEAVRQSEEKFSKAFQANPSVVVISGLKDGRLLDLNDAFVQVTGYSREEVIGKSVADLGLWAVPEKRVQLLEIIKAKGFARDFEVEFKTKGGELRTAICAFEKIDIEGQECLLSASLDVTDRKKLEDDLLVRTHELGERMKEINCLFMFSQIAETPGLGISDICARAVKIIPGGWQYPDITAAKLTFEDETYTTGNFRETPWSQSADIVLNKSIAGTIQVVYLEGRSEFEEGPFLAEERHLINELATRFSTAVEGKRSLSALRKSELRSRTIIDSTMDAVILADQNSVILEFNPAAEKIFGFRSEDAIGKTIPELLIPERYREKHCKGMEQYVQTGKANILGKHMTLTGLCADGSEIPVELTISPIELPEGPMFAGIIRDLREKLDAENSLQQSTEKIHRSLLGTIQVLAHTIEKRDPYTAGHQERVAKLAAAIAGKMNLADEDILGIEMGSLIHDIGKIHIPGEILTRPGKFSQEEFNLIKTHCQVGYDIVKEVDLPWPVADMILQHHERLDGSGYPHGLSNGDICLESRILSVADVVEAITSHRPYRPAKGMDIALEEITKNRGTRFDPDAVDACVGLVKDLDSLDGFL